MVVAYGGICGLCPSVPNGIALMIRCPCTCEMSGGGAGRGELACADNAFCACPCPLSVPILCQFCGMIHLKWKGRNDVERGDQVGNVTIPLKRVQPAISIQKEVEPMHMEPRA